MRPDGMAEVIYSTGTQTIGTREVYCCGASDSGKTFSAYWPHTAYFCPFCGQVWARAQYFHRFNYSPRVDQPWAIEIRKCLSHGDGQLLVGQPLDGCDAGLIAWEFRALMARENMTFPGESGAAMRLEDGGIRVCIPHQIGLI